MFSWQIALVSPLSVDGHRVATCLLGQPRHGLDERGVRSAQNLRAELVDDHSEFTQRMHIVNETAEQGREFLAKVGDLVWFGRVAGCGAAIVSHLAETIVRTSRSRQSDRYAPARED